MATIKDLKDVMCWDMNPSKEVKDIQIKILDRLINEETPNNNLK